MPSSACLLSTKSIINTQLEKVYSLHFSHIENWFLFSKLIKLDTTVFFPSMILLSYPVLV